MALLSRRTDLPFGRDDSSRYLPWLTAFMVFLASLTLAGIFALGDLASTWDKGLSETLTVQLPAGEDERTDERRAAAAIKILEATEGVEEVTLLPPRQVRELLKPWLGDAADASRLPLPLPQIIDVAIDRDDIPALAALTERLRRAVPGAAVDDHGAWMSGFLRVLRSTEAIGVLIFLLVGAATVGTIVFTTRAGLGVHREVIEVMHLVGAHDRYIAAQFAVRSMMLGLRGAAMGIISAAMVLIGLGVLVEFRGFGVLPGIDLSLGAWIAVALLLPATGLLAWLTARITVLRSLARMV